LNTLINYFENYVYHDKIMLESDGYIGIPVDIAVLYNEKRFGTVKPGANGTPIILYVINTAIERVGTAEDKDIILSALKKKAGSDNEYVIRLYNGSDCSKNVVFSFGDDNVELTFGKFEVKTLVYSENKLSESEMMII